LKILQINNYGFRKGGSDTYFIEIIEELYRRPQITIDAYTSVDDRNEISNRNADISIRDLSRLSMSLYFNWSHFRRLRSIVAEYDIVHVHIYYGQLSNSVLFALHSFKGKIFFTLHEYKLVCGIGTSLNNNKLCKKCSVNNQWPILFSSCDTGSFKRRMGLLLDNIISHALFSLIHDPHFLFVSEFQRSVYSDRARSIIKSAQVLPLFSSYSTKNTIINMDNNKRILYAGRIEEAKGVFILLDAFRLLNHEFILEFAGFGSDFQKLKEQIEFLNLSDRVVLHGLLSKAELENVFRRATYFVNPSSYLETFGLVNLEAMALGCVVITSGSGALSEIIKDGYNGFIIPSLTPSGILNTIKRAENNINSVLMTNAINTANKFSLERHVDSLINIYKYAGTNR
jgi:glycosyltransferase involved in cell wall biosynthesis